MVGAQDPYLVGQQFLGQPESVAGITVPPGSQRDVVPGGEGLRPVGAQDPDLIGQQLLE